MNNYSVLEIYNPSEKLISKNLIKKLNGIPFGSRSKGKPSPRSYTIQCDRKWEYSFLSVLPWVSVLPKTTAIRRAAVRETSVSRHHGGPIEGPPETPRTSQHYHIEGINYVKGNGNSFLSVIAAHKPRYRTPCQPCLRQGNPLSRAVLPEFTCKSSLPYAKSSLLHHGYFSFLNIK